MSWALWLVWLVYAWCHASAMMARNKRTYDEAELTGVPGARLRANVVDLFAQNVLSGKRAQDLCNDAADCGIAEFRSLKNTTGSNQARHLRGKALKHCPWPDLYWAKVRCLDKRTQASTSQWVAMMLPHEYVMTLAKFGKEEVLYATDGLDAVALEHLRECEAAAGQKLMPLGLWGDGVPCNWDRTESVDCLVINLPGQSGPYKPLRMPLSGISKKQITEETWEDLFGIVQWSFRCAAIGRMPERRHDDAPWLKSDIKRRRQGQANASLGVRACLVEVRGDWDFYAKVFSFPKWNTLAGCCWKCKLTPDRVLGSAK
jgi:hypothetical protein